MDKLSELQQVANLPRRIKVGDKEFEIRSPSLGVSVLIAREMREILEILEIDPKRFTSLEEAVRGVLKGIYDAFTSDKAEKVVDKICRILSLLINNCKEEKVITAEEIKWQLTISDFLPLLIDAIRAADISDFFLLLLKMAQAYDIEGILSISASSSGASRKQQDGQSTT